MTSLRVRHLIAALLILICIRYGDGQQGACRTQLSGAGNISTINYPNTYPGDVDCQWLITSAYDVVLLNIIDFCISGNSRFNIYDGRSNTVLIATLSGCSSDPPVYYIYYTTQKFMFITFSPYNYSPYWSRGFLAAYSSVSLIRYEVNVYTGTGRWAGTNANVYIVLYDSDTNSEEILLDNLDNNDFESGHVDSFELEIPALGSLTSISIRRDYAGLGSEWFLLKVTVTDTRDNSIYEFPCDDWVAFGSRILYVGEVYYLTTPVSSSTSLSLTTLEGPRQTASLETLFGGSNVTDITSVQTRQSLSASTIGAVNVGEPNGPDGRTIGLAVGLSVGLALILLIVIIVVIICFVRRRQRKRPSRSSTTHLEARDQSVDNHYSQFAAKSTPNTEIILMATNGDHVVPTARSDDTVQYSQVRPGSELTVIDNSLYESHERQPGETDNAYESAAPVMDSEYMYGQQGSEKPALNGSSAVHYANVTKENKLDRDEDLTVIDNSLYSSQEH